MLTDMPAAKEYLRKALADPKSWANTFAIEYGQDLIDRVETLERSIAATKCPFCDKPLAQHDILNELVCSCCHRPMEACPDRFTVCANGHASVDASRCDICGALIDDDLVELRAAAAAVASDEFQPYRTEGSAEAGLPFSIAWRRLREAQAGLRSRL